MNTEKTKSDRNVVSFELHQEALEALLEDAKSRKSRSHHQRAREIVIDYLARGEIQDLSEQVAGVDANLVHLTDLLRRVAFSVIVHAAGKPSEVANAWIRENMPVNKSSSS